MSWKFYDLLSQEPDFNEAPRYGLFDEREMIPGSDGDTFVAWPDRTDRVLAFAFQTFSAQEWKYLRDFFDRHAGRAKSFYLPSWSFDFTIAETALTGTKLITVEGTWHSENVTDNRPDTIGRRIFTIDQNGTFQAHWVSAITTDGTNDTLVLEDPITTDLESGKSHMGLVYLARAAEDTFQSEHISPNHVRLPVTFRQVNHRRALNQQESAPAPAIQNLKPAFDIIATDDDPIFNTLTTSRCLGTEGYGFPQSINYSNQWTATLNKETNLVTITDGTTSLVSELYDANAPAEQIAIAFDPLGNEILAWSEGETIRVGWKESGDIERRSFAGYSCAAFNSYELDSTIVAGDATVAVFYIKRGDTTIYCRTLADSFATEHRYLKSPLAPIYLHETRQAEARMEIVGMDANHRLARWRSEVYQLPTEVQKLTSTVDDFTGEYVDIRRLTEQEDGLTSTVDLIEGEYRSIREFLDAGEDSLASFIDADAFGGSYEETRIPITLDDDSLTSTIDSAFVGSYSLSRKQLEKSDSLTSTIDNFTGSYAP